MKRNQITPELFIEAVRMVSQSEDKLLEARDRWNAALWGLT